MEFDVLWAALHGVSAYAELLKTPVMEQSRALVGSLAQGRGTEALEAYTQLFHLLRREGYQGLGDWLWDGLRYVESPYGTLAERGDSDPALENAARREVETFLLLARMDCDRYVGELSNLLPPVYAPVLAGLPRWRASAPFDFDGLTAFYQENGCGLFARYRAFVWDSGELIPVADPDCPRPEELMGYELQRGQVVANTQAMLEGHLVNNVLLFGDGGTGKSATVKSMLFRPGFGDLRLIEVQKEGLAQMPRLIRSLAGRRQKFILFIDDLAFDQDDNTYSIMKTILEGGLERRPANVAIYATSNRRHLVRECFADRDGDEIHRGDTMQESLSLSDRFGLSVNFSVPDKTRYLDIVHALAEERGLEVSGSQLDTGAEQGALARGGRSPRCAKQYIAMVESRLKQGLPL